MYARNKERQGIPLSFNEVVSWQESLRINGKHTFNTHYPWEVARAGLKRCWQTQASKSIVGHALRKEGVVSEAEPGRGGEAFYNTILSGMTKTRAEWIIHIYTYTSLASWSGVKGWSWQPKRSHNGSTYKHILRKMQVRPYTILSSLTLKRSDAVGPKSKLTGGPETGCSASSRHSFTPPPPLRRVCLPFGSIFTAKGLYKYKSTQERKNISLFPALDKVPAHLAED